MRQILYILTSFIFFFTTTSCDIKTGSKLSEEKTIVEDEAAEQIEITAIRHTRSLESLTQTELFENLVDAIYLNDMPAFGNYIQRFRNIDSLALFTPYGEDANMYYSLLGMACKQNRLIAMKDLIMRGANITLGSKDEFSDFDALYYAISGGNAEMVKILVDMGTDVNMLYSSAGITPLALSVISHKHVMAEILLEAGAKVNGAGNLGDDYVLYPLHDAIRENDVAMVKILLNHGADIKLKDRDRIDAVALAKKMNFDEISSLLKQKQQ